LLHKEQNDEVIFSGIINFSFVSKNPLVVDLQRNKDATEYKNWYHYIHLKCGVTFKIIFV